MYSRNLAENQSITDSIFASALQKSLTTYRFFLFRFSWVRPHPSPDPSHQPTHGPRRRLDTPDQTVSASGKYFHYSGYALTVQEVLSDFHSIATI